MKCTETPFRALARIKLGQQKCLYLGNLDSWRAMIEATAHLRGQITVKEVQIGAMRTFATEGNPQLQLAQQELEAMKRELGKIEGAGGAKVGEGNAGNTADAPFWPQPEGRVSFWAHGGVAKEACDPLPRSGRLRRERVRARPAVNDTAARFAPCPASQNETRAYVKLSPTGS